MKKIGLIIIAFITVFFSISIIYYLIKGDKTLTKDEAIALVDVTYTKSPEDKSFSTDKKTYKNAEQVIIHKEGKPIIGWKFSTVTTANSKETNSFEGENKRLNDSDIIRLELEVENFDYDTEAYSPDSSIDSSVYVTDKGDELFRTAKMPFTSLNIGEKGTFTYFMHSKKKTTELGKIYLRFYYVNPFLDFPPLPPANYIDFELEVSH